MLEPCVDCPGEDVVCERELFDSPQPLKHRRVNNPDFGSGQANKTMDGVSDNFLKFHRSQQGTNHDARECMHPGLPYGSQVLTR